MAPRRKFRTGTTTSFASAVGFGDLQSHFLRQPHHESSICNPSLRNRSIPRCSATVAQGISVDRLCQWWPDGTRVLTNISLHVAPGEIAMVAGPNGCGKTTLLRVLGGVLLPDLGQVFVDQPCRFILQDSSKQLIMPTVHQNISISHPLEPLKEMAKRDKAEAKRMLTQFVTDALETVGFTAEDIIDKSINELSGGQTQRVALAAALKSEPRVMLLDEITASLDGTNRARITEFLPKLIRDKSIAALWYVSHIYKSQCTVLPSCQSIHSSELCRSSHISISGPHASACSRIFEGRLGTNVRFDSSKLSCLLPVAAQTDCKIAV